MYEWKILIVRIAGAGADDFSAAAETLVSHFAAIRGVTFVWRDKVIAIIHDDHCKEVESLKAALKQKLPSRECTCILRQMTGTALRQITENFFGEKSHESLFAKRLNRPDNRILVIDDDAFYRAVLKKACEKDAEVYQSEDGKNAIQLYQEINPDMVLLDIHLPLSYGFLILEDFLNLDFDAFVAMISSDSSSHNVITARDMGSAGFLKKPLDPDELQQLFQSCPTFKRAAQKESRKG